MKEKTANPLTSLSGTVSLGGELTIRRLGFGAMRITGDGIWGPPEDPASALAVLRRAVELGVNFIDTADSYGPYTSEELIAKALAPYPRNLVIATKGGWNRPGPDQWTHDANRLVIIAYIAFFTCMGTGAYFSGSITLLARPVLIERSSVV